MNPDPDPESQPRVYESLKKHYEANRDFDANASWGDWLRDRYAKYWYGVGSLLLDGLVVGITLQITDPSQVWPYVLSAALVVGLLYLEFRGFLHFWPPKPPE